MKGPRADAALCRTLRLMVIVERGLCAPREVTEVVRAALRGGATSVQLRNKGDSARELAAAARELLPVTRSAGAPLVINDRLDVALAVGADGVHLGPEDLPVSAARRVSPPPFVVGFSEDNPEAAHRAVADCASYIGCGTVFPTGSKADAGEAIGPMGIRRVVRAIDLPVVAIGGITPANAATLAGTGAAGLAVIGALMSAGDPEAVARELRAAADAAAESS